MIKNQVDQVDPREAARQIADKAESELRELHTRLQALTEKQSQLALEQTQIQQAQSQRSVHLIDIRGGLADVEKQHKQAKSYASVAQGTIGEQEAVRQVVRLQQHYENARASVSAVETEYAELDSIAATRLAEIADELATLSAACSQIQARLREVQDVSARAIRELGEHTHACLMGEYALHETAIEEAKRQLVELEVERRRFLESAQTSLSQWPDQARKIRLLLPHDNATLRIIRSGIAYIETLIRDGSQIERHMRAAIIANYGYNWLSMLAVPIDDLWVNETLTGPKRGLNARLVALRTLLQQYEATQ